MLNDGIEIEGIFWESDDRILHPNGTIEYKLTGKSEKAKIVFGTVDEQGRIQLLPKLGKHKTSLSLLKVSTLTCLKRVHIRLFIFGKKFHIF